MQCDLATGESCDDGALHTQIPAVWSVDLESWAGRPVFYISSQSDHPANDGYKDIQFLSAHAGYNLIDSASLHLRVYPIPLSQQKYQ